MSLLFGRTLSDTELGTLAGLLRTLRPGRAFEEPHLMFQIPPWREPDARGELHVYRDGRESSGGEQEDRVVLFLETERFGPMRVEISVRGREVRCEFQLLQDEACSRLRESLRDLDEGLSGQGYLVTYLACTMWGVPNRLGPSMAGDLDWFV